MRVYVLVGIKDRSYRDDNGFLIPDEEHKNVGVFQSRQDAVSEVVVNSSLGKWGYDDYDIEEFDI